jgi:hypothetical protein
MCGDWTTANKVNYTAHWQKKKDQIEGEQPKYKLYSDTQKLGHFWIMPRVVIISGLQKNVALTKAVWDYML